MRIIRRLAAACALLAATSVAVEAVAQDRALVNIVVSTHGMVYLPIFAADALGYFEESGVEAEVRVFGGGGGSPMASVIAGDMDIYAGTTNSALAALGQGAEVSIIGALVTQYASNVVMRAGYAKEHGITAESPLKDKLAALKGARFGVTGAGSGTHQLALYLLDLAGLDPERDASVIFIGGGGPMLAALANERLDVINISNPTSDMAIKEHGAVPLFNMTAGEVKELDGFLYLNYIARKDWIAQYPERGKAVLEALQKGLDAIKDPARVEEVRTAVQKAYFPAVDPEIFSLAWDAIIPAYPKTMEVSAEQVQRSVDFTNKFAETPISIDVGTAFTNELLLKR